jgi:phosphonate dehydrogenase
MTAPKVVISNWVHPEVHALLEPHCTLITNTTRSPWTQSRIIEECADAQAFMAFMPDSVDLKFLEQCPNLGIVACALKGFDNFDVQACTQHGVWVTMVPDLLTAPSAELAVGLLIGLGRNIGPGDQFIRSNQFDGWRPVLYGSGLDKSVVGILGLGQVGQAIAARLQGFGCSRILYHDPIVSGDAQGLKDLESVDFPELLSTSDFLILAAPLTDTSVHCIDAKALDQMQTGSRLINIGRGSVVDEQAVSIALENGKLAGYAADVFESEDWAREGRPKVIPPQLLAQKDKTLFTPHIGSAVDRVRIEIAHQAGESILQYLRGEIPFGAVNQVSISDSE